MSLKPQSTWSSVAITGWLDLPGESGTFSSSRVVSNQGIWPLEKLSLHPRSNPATHGGTELQRVVHGVSADQIWSFGKQRPECHAAVLMICSLIARVRGLLTVPANTVTSGTCLWEEGSVLVIHYGEICLSISKTYSNCFHLMNLMEQESSESSLLASKLGAVCGVWREGDKDLILPCQSLLKPHPQMTVLYIGPL